MYEAVQISSNTYARVGSPVACALPDGHYAEIMDEVPSGADCLLYEASVTVDHVETYKFLGSTAAAARSGAKIIQDELAQDGRSDEHFTCVVRQVTLISVTAESPGETLGRCLGPFASQDARELMALATSGILTRCDTDVLIEQSGLSRHAVEYWQY